MKPFLKTAAFALVLAACGGASLPQADKPAAETASAAQTKVVMDTNQGRVVMLLDAQKAPQTVANFKQYAEQGFYNGTVFHRVIDGFMVQGGGFTADMVQKPTAAPVANEADNGLKNHTGTVAMARTADPHSATSQFFINVADNAFLNHTGKTAQGYGYTVFGKVVEGMDVVQKIAKVRTGNRAGHQDVPLEPVVINSVQIVGDK